MVNADNYKSFRKEISEVLSVKNPIKYEFPDGINMAFERVVIKKQSNGSPILYLDEFCNKEYMRKWKTKVGDIFYKDVKKNRLDLYFELEITDYKILLRIIKDDELKEFENNSAIADNIIKSGDINFLIIKIIEIESSYSIRDIIKNSFDYNENENEMNNDEDEQDEFEEPELTSLSLFDENE